MKYFVTAAERLASNHENYVEFQPPTATEEFWDGSSLYMLEAEMAETGFGEFWSNCVPDILFDMDSFTKEDLSQMLEIAKQFGGTVLAVINELWAWVDTNMAEPTQRVGVNWAFDRALARWREEREAYPMDPKFLEDVRAIDENLGAGEHQEEYERLLMKYNMPKFFFPFPLDEPENW